MVNVIATLFKMIKLFNASLKASKISLYDYQKILYDSSLIAEFILSKFDYMTTRQEFFNDQK
jgi:hypothetical protein